MGTVVIDKKTLVGGAAKLIGLLTTLVTALFALNTAAVSATGNELCSLSAKQRSGIQAAANAILDGGNSSCSYTMTLDSILAD